MARAKTRVAQSCQAMEVTDLTRKLARIEEMVVELLEHFRNPVEKRAAYTVDEASELLSTSKNTIRIWCRDGRINASRRAEKSGGVELWSIPAQEITRYKDEGLLPRDLGRNAR